jgi:hypothetical protein
MSPITVVQTIKLETDLPPGRLHSVDIIDICYQPKRQTIVLIDWLDQNTYSVRIQR